MAQRTPDRLRAEAAGLGPAIGTYVDRLLCAREHPSRVSAPVSAAAARRRLWQERLALACERALAAGVLSSRYVERLLKADRRRPFLDGGVEASLGEHANLRGSAYYN